MKSFLLGLAIILSVNAWAQGPVTFKATTHSFGKIKYNVPVTTEFEFTNTSSKPVVIEAVTPSCGCTTPDYPKAPILKGKTGKIKVSYNAATEGKFDKSIIVKFANAAPITLMISGEVVPAKKKS